MGGIKVKKEGFLKLVLSILIIVLLCLVSLGGVYWKNKNIMENKIKDYNLGMDLGTNTLIKLEVAKEEEKSSEENNQTSEEGQASEENKTEKTYSIDDYKKSKKIIEKRLEIAKIEQYTIRLNENSGDVIIEVPNDTDTVALQSILTTGKVEMKIKKAEIKEDNAESADTNATENKDKTEDNKEENKEENEEKTEEVKEELIITNKDIKKVETGVDETYKNEIGSIVKFNIEFTSEATARLNEIKKNYVVPVDKYGNQKENTIVFTIDDNEICSLTETEFLATAVHGTLPLQLGTYTKEQVQLDTALKEANYKKIVIESEQMPIKYTVAYTNDIHSNVESKTIYMVFGIIFGLMCLYFIIKYKFVGILSGATIAGLISALLLVVRYTNLQMSIAGLVALGTIMLLQFVYLVKVLSSKKLNKKSFNEKTIQITKMLIPAFIFSVVIAFANILEINGFGMVMFWGIILFELFNNIITRAILTNVKNK